MRKLDADYFEEFWGYSDHSPAEALREWSERSGINPTIEGEDNGSVDPSWIVRFPDGSIAHVGNPHEEVFSGSVEAYPFDSRLIDLKKARRQVEDSLRKSSGALIETLRYLYRRGLWEPTKTK